MQALIEQLHIVAATRQGRGKRQVDGNIRLLAAGLAQRTDIAATGQVLLHHPAVLQHHVDPTFQQLGQVQRQCLLAGRRLQALRKKGVIACERRGALVVWSLTK